MKAGWGIALIGALMVSAAARAEPVNQRIYDLTLRSDLTPHWLDAPKVPVLLRSDNRWSLQRMRSKVLHVSSGVLTASAYVVRPQHSNTHSLEQAIPGRVSSAAAGADLGMRVADGLTLLTRAAVLKVRSHSYFGGYRPRSLKSDRMLIGAGVAGPGNATLIVDYIRASAGMRHIDRVFGMPRNFDQAGSGPRLTLAGATGGAEGAANWTLTFASMQRPEVQYGQAIVTPTQLDRRVMFGMRIGL